jgi:hypothetical protein
MSKEPHFQFGIPLTKPLVLDAVDLKPLLSAYLEQGYKQDTIVLRRVEVTPPSAHATFDVTNYSLPSDGQYHFTSIHAMIGVSQVGIVLASLDNGFDEKPGEIYMREFTIVCRRTIHRVEGLRMNLMLEDRVRVSDHVLYDITYDFDGGAFTGTLRCLFPLRVCEAAE